ncbi:unnamed protein product [Hyaloperonospora brassicae]|uniref:Uncharacterized protein n=1 Tax=Hyaloperonospora brassicae TaxID=162125 RepID=A0AAV0STW0_HYABA|nr:unnamed protein product [Hyaloperonospora brassicae]
MASPLVRALYRALLRSTQTLQRDLEAGQTLFDAVRASAVPSYAGIKSDWHRERAFVRRFEDAAVLRRRDRRDRLFATIVRAEFAAPVEIEHRTALDARVDAAFAALRRVDDHNALIRALAARGAFQSKERTDAVKFRIGDVVQVEGEKRGVIFAWHVVAADTLAADAGARVVYDVLPHSPGSSFATKLYHVPQDKVRRDGTLKAVQHPSLLLYFDGFDGTRHIMSRALAARYPRDVAGNPKDSDVVVAVPSIIQLQSADEDELLTYLRCDDSTIVQFAIASLEGIWLGEGGPNAQGEVQRAVELAGQKKWDQAREILHEVVHGHSEYAYAWSKLAMVEYQSGNFGKALGHYETAVKLKPQLVEALIGLGTCATRLRRWTLVHHAAVQLLKVQPRNDTARMLIEQAVCATL